ncbi:MAG: ATP-binding protein [Anaerolineae bacterium]|nr:ATP-binding protein [Anaerolineae bacterium]
MRFFNTAGPVNCADHYCLPPLGRVNLHEILTLIAQKKYFVLHAPRQVGKTSLLLALRDHLNATGRYRCLYINVESAQAAREDVRAAMRVILAELMLWESITLQDHFFLDNANDILARYGEFSVLDVALTLWAGREPARPAVLLIDEIDALVGDTLISVLRQLRSGYAKRPAAFPQSVILCGVRDVRDYRIHSEQEKTIITGGSAFNIKAASLRLGDFSQAEMQTLYQQHTTETGQPFTPEALALAWDLTQGQPWLVNALGYETCFQVPDTRDRDQPITAELILEAKEAIILRRETHLDQLTDKLKEPRVRRVIEPILVGEVFGKQFRADDVQYVVDLGLVRQDRTGALQLANRIYQEVIPRELTWDAQTGMTLVAAWYILPDGRLEVDKLIAAFQSFFREHSEHWVERFDYKEAGPQLLLQAFLQRIVNGGGRIEREYGLGHGRTDLLILWPYGEAEPRPVQKVVVETKLRHKSLETTIAEGSQQTWEYMDRCAAEAGHLVIFDRDSSRTWDEKIFRRIERYQDRPITVWGM